MSSTAAQPELPPATPPTAAADTMAAIVQSEYGAAPEEVLRLERTDRPTLGEQEALVRIRAASVDRGTWHLMAGLPYPIRLAGFGVRRPKYNPGRSFAGTVDAVGTQVRGLDWPTCRAVLEERTPGAVAQAVGDADTFFGVELPA